MLQVNYLKENQESIIKSLLKRNVDYSNEINKAIELDEQRKKIQTNLDSLLSESNTTAKSIGDLFKSGKIEEANSLKEKSTQIKPRIKELQENLSSIKLDLESVLYTIPNIPHPLVKQGKDDSDNEIVFESESVDQNENNLLPHWELAKNLDIIDFELGNKITGAGFPLYKGKGAKLQRGLINYFLDKNTDAGYHEIQPPILINENSGFGTGQLPDKEGQMYHVTNDNLYLIPTAEVPITNIYRDTIVNKKELPIKLTGYTPCFRREAGSYGSHVRGLNRLHQFDKVEIVRIESSENSYDVLDEMLDHVKSLLSESSCQLSIYSTSACLPSVSTSFLSVVISSFNSSDTRVIVPCLRPVSTILNFVFLNFSFISLELNIVAISISSISSFNRYFLTQPPTNLATIVSPVKPS